jgi:hypothetical protein
VADSLEEVLKLLGLGSPFIYAAGTFGLFHYLDRQASADAKKAISGWLKLHDHGGVAIAGTLVELFDRLYPRPLLGWRAALRSTLLTSVITALALFEIAPTVAEFIEAFSKEAGFPPIVIFLSNSVSGYASLFAVRQVLLVGRNRPLIALTGGALVGMFVVVVANLIRDLVFVSWIYRTERGAQVYLETFSPAHLFDPDLLRFSLPALGVYLWLPLFGLGLLCLRGLSYFFPAARKMQWLLKQGDEHPLDAVGYVLATLVLAGTGIVQLIR